MCWRKLGTSGNPWWLRSLPRSLFTVWNDFDTRADVITGRLSCFPSHFLGFNLEGQVTGRRSCFFFCCQKILAVSCDHFGSKAECWRDFGSYPVPIFLALNLVFKMILKTRFKIIFVLSAPNLSSLNKLQNTSLASCAHFQPRRNSQTNSLFYHSPSAVFNL